MIQVRFMGFAHGLPCFLVFDEDYHFRVEISARGEVLKSKEKDGVHQLLIVLGTQETVIIEQFGAVVMVLHGEAVGV